MDRRVQCANAWRAAVKNRILIAACVSLCVACVPSLHPLYTDRDLVYEPALEGQWHDSESDERWNFQRAGERSYRLVVSDDDSWGAFDAHLLKVGAHYFLDLYPADWDSSVNEMHRAHLLPVHTFLSVRRFEPVLEMAAVKGGWLKDYLRDHPGELDHEIVDDEVLLTAEPKAMQAFLRAHLDSAFDDYGTLKRAP